MEALDRQIYRPGREGDFLPAPEVHSLKMLPHGDGHEGSREVIHLSHNVLRAEHLSPSISVGKISLATKVIDHLCGVEWKLDR